MLGIILDNATEAQEKLTDKQFHIAFVKINTSLHVIIENACATNIPKLHVLKKQGFSTKGENRGLGLSSLQELINQSPNSHLITTINDHQFNQTIIINNEGD